MGQRLSGLVARDLRTLMEIGAVAGLTDAELLDLFERRGGAASEAAFEALVDRHGAMVLRVCRGLLRDEADVEDAFQATFLVLARKVGSIRDRESPGRWLFGVAARVAAKARVEAARRKARERLTAGPVIGVEDDPARREPDLGPMVLEEVRRLPEKYRAPVILCDLEGRTYEEAARQLRCPLGTIKVRLSRARALLRSRLTRRGLAPDPVRPIAGAIPIVPLALARRAAQLATAGVAGSRAAMVPARVLILTEGVLKGMLISQGKVVAAVLFTGSVLAAGAGALALQDPGAGRAGPPGTTRPKPSEVVSPSLPPFAGQAIRRAIDAARTIESPPEKAEALLRIGQAQTRLGDPRAARETLREAIRAADSGKPTDNWTIPHPLIRIAEAQAQAGDRDAAHRTFGHAVEVIRTLSPDDPMGQMSHWINLLPTQERVEGRTACRESIEAYRRYLTTEIDKTQFRTFNPISLAGLQAMLGDFEGALKFANDPENFPGFDGDRGRIAALLNVVQALRPGDREFIEPVLTLARRTIADQADITMRNQDWKAIARVLSQLGRFDEALATASLIEVDFSPMSHREESAAFNKALTFGDIAADQLKAGDRAGARKSAGVSVSIVKAIEAEGFRPVPMQKAAGILVDAGDLEGGLDAIASLNPKNRPEYLLWLASERGRAGNEEAALAILKRALPEAEESLHEARLADANEAQGDRIALVSTLVAKIQARMGDLEAALRTIEPLSDGAKQAAWGWLAAMRAEAGDVKSALELVERMDPPGRRIRAILGIIASLPARNVEGSPNLP
ncbi:sigma-70 family RNA polymerase sigma factor [Tundrisphaera lichenicola]|uniref:sigma-70 family RNA polymerase sigma factor n=1 Tax=Tundrisphaera lichenicola TaxID=2029860 RepID=UPI003EBEC88A